MSTPRLFTMSLIVNLISIQSGVAAQTERRDVAGAINASSPEELQSDFDLMRHAVEEAHPGLYRYSTKAEMDQGFDAQRAKLNRTITKWEFEAVLAESIALVRCGHTGLKRDRELESAMKHARTFPFRVLFEGRRLKVLLNDTPDDQTIRPGMEIVAINGRKTADLVDRILSTASADGDIETGKRRAIADNFPLYYWWLIERVDEFTVTAADAAGRTTTVKRLGVTDAERGTNQNPVNDAMKAGLAKATRVPRENLSFRFLNAPRIAAIRLRSFSGDDFRQWLEDTFKTLCDKGTETLVIDLRGNAGGDDMYGAAFASYLTNKPFRYFDRIHVKTIAPSFIEHTDLKADDEWLKRIRQGATPNPAGGFFLTPQLHPGLAEQSPGKHPFLGKVIVLIDGGTSSTASDFCAVVHHLKRATFVGEETGGGYSGNNSGMMPTLTLPNSGVRIRLPMYEYWNAVPGHEGERRGTRPDRAVEVTAASLLSGVDEPLEQALQLAGGGEGAPK